MKIPTQLTEKTLSALQIAKLTGQVKSGLFEVLRAVESKKAKYIIISLDAKFRRERLKRKFAVLKLMAQENKIFCFELSTKKMLGDILGIETGASCVAIINPDRAESLFKDVIKQIQENIQV